MLKFGNKEFRNIQEQVEKNAKDIEKLIEEGVPGGGTGGSGLPTDEPTADGQILIGNTDGTVEWSTETIHEYINEDEFEELVRATPTSVSIIEDQGKLELMLEHDGTVLDVNETPNTLLQKKLVSGTNIKTINGVSILGSGDLQIGEGGGTVDLSDYYTKTEADNQFAAKTTFDTTVMGINAVLDDIPTTYATNAGVAGLEATIRGEIETIENSKPLAGFPTQNFYIDSSGNYTKITNYNAGSEILQLDVVSLLTTDWNFDYAAIYTFFKEDVLGITRGGGRGRIYVEPGWNTWDGNGDATNGTKLWLLCVNSGIEVGTFNDPLPTAFIVEYVDSVLTLEMILKNNTRAIMVINYNNGVYSSNGFKEIVYGGGSSGGGITTTDPVTSDGQILIGNIDGTYNWTTETFYELTSRISALETVVNNITYYEGETE